MAEVDMKCSVKDTFYFDPSADSCESLTARAKRLGLKTREFLCNGVTVCVAAVAGREKTTEEAAAGSLRGRRTNRIYQMMVQAQAVPKTAKSWELHRSMVDQVRELGATMMSGQAFRIWLEGQESKLASGTASTRKGNVHARPLISRSQRARTDRFKSKENPRVVIKDLDGLEPDRVQAFPPELLRKCILHENAPSGICPFTPREQWDREVLKVKKKDAQCGTWLVENQVPMGRQKSRRGGWCECCEKQYIGTMSEHCASGEHHAIVAADPNFATLLSLESWTPTGDDLTVGNEISLQGVAEKEGGISAPLDLFASMFVGAGAEAVVGVSSSRTVNVLKGDRRNENLPENASPVRLAKTTAGQVPEQVLLQNGDRVVNTCENNALVENTKFHVEGKTNVRGVECSASGGFGEVTPAQRREEKEHELDVMMETNENISLTTSGSRPETTVNKIEVNALRIPLRVCLIRGPNDASPPNENRGRKREQTSKHDEPSTVRFRREKKSGNAKDPTLIKALTSEEFTEGVAQAVLDSQADGSHASAAVGPMTNTLQPGPPASPWAEACKSADPVSETRGTLSDRVLAKGEVRPSRDPSTIVDPPAVRPGAQSSSRHGRRKKPNRELRMLADSPGFISAQSRRLSSVRRSARTKSTGGGGGRNCDGNRNISLSATGARGDVAVASPEAVAEGEAKHDNKADDVGICSSSSSKERGKGGGCRASKILPNSGGRPDVPAFSKGEAMAESLNQCRQQPEKCIPVNPEIFDRDSRGPIDLPTRPMFRETCKQKSHVELERVQKCGSLGGSITKRRAAEHGGSVGGVASSELVVGNDDGGNQQNVSSREERDLPARRKSWKEQSNDPSKSGDVYSSSPFTGKTYFSEASRGDGNLSRERSFSSAIRDKKAKGYLDESCASSGSLDTGSSAIANSSICGTRKRQREQKGLRTSAPTTAIRMGLQSGSDGEDESDRFESYRVYSGYTDSRSQLPSGSREEGKTSTVRAYRRFEKEVAPPGREVATKTGGGKSAARNPVDVVDGGLPSEMRARIATESPSTQSKGWKPTRVL